MEADKPVRAPPVEVRISIPFLQLFRASRHKDVFHFIRNPNEAILYGSCCGVAILKYRAMLI
jgi:hypothetical protein